MGTFFGILWIFGFGLVGIFCFARRQETTHYESFRAKVTKIHRSPGKHTAVLQPEITQLHSFEIEFQDIGDYHENDMVQCIWDGNDETTIQEDLRENLKRGIVFSFAAVGLMFAIFLINLMV